MLLKSANLSEQHEQLAKATASDLKCDVMKDQLKKIFGDLSCIPPTSSSVSQVQVEDINQVEGKVAESWNSAVLDSEASKTVCGQAWLNTYLNSLNESDQSKVSYRNSSSSYRFGDGNKVMATKSVQMPAVIGNQSVMIETDIVQSDIPLLLSRSSKKKANMHLNFEDDTVKAFNQDINLVVTKSGHYVLPLTLPCQLLSRCGADPKLNVTLSAEHTKSKEEIAVKLHRQFAHPPAHKLNQLLNSAGVPWREEGGP